MQDRSAGAPIHGAEGSLIHRRAAASPRLRRAHLLTLLLGAACGAGGAESGGAGGGDSTPPAPGTVADGTGADVDTQTSTSVLSANWTGFQDEGGITGYECAVGTAAGIPDVLAWIAVGTTTTVSAGGFALQTGTTYHVGVRARDAAGNVSVAVWSDGVAVQGGTGGGPSTARALSQWGITWTFAADAPCGQFANGDWWVVGPVDVVDIAPRTQLSGARTINGSMVNPVPNGVQGYDSGLYDAFAAGRYDPALNVATGISTSTPRHLPAGSSLVSTISQLTPATNGSLSQLRTAAVLTVLAAAPPSDAFRPAYAGTDKTIRFRESQLDYTRLAAVPRGTGAPSLTATADKLARVWLDHTPGWLSRYLHPVENMPDYSRDFTSLLGTAGLLLNLDFSFAEKRDLLVRLVQIGIDFHGNVLGGCNWGGTGGQCSGRKFPILFAGRVLADATMTAIGTSHATVFLGPGNAANTTTFGEDSQTFVVAQTSPGVYNWGYGNYTSQHVGMAEWGNSHTPIPSNDNVDWGIDPYRRCCTANAWVGQALTVRIMGLRSLWNHQVYFDYLDRYMTAEAAGSWTRAWEPWHETMWTAWRVAF